MPPPALDSYLVAHPDDGPPLTADELAMLARLAARVFETGELLVRYVLAVGGKPGRN